MVIEPAVTDGIEVTCTVGFILVFMVVSMMINHRSWIRNMTMSTIIMTMVTKLCKIMILNDNITADELFLSQRS